jgi:hypothetical protein
MTRGKDLASYQTTEHDRRTLPATMTLTLFASEVTWVTKIFSQAFPNRDAEQLVGLRNFSLIALESAVIGR